MSLPLDPDHEVAKLRHHGEDARVSRLKLLVQEVLNGRLPVSLDRTSKRRPVQSNAVFYDWSGDQFKNGSSDPQTWCLLQSSSVKKGLIFCDHVSNADHPKQR